jgi:hypothetical protein
MVNFISVIGLPPIPSLGFSGIRRAPHAFFLEGIESPGDELRFLVGVDTENVVILVGEAGISGLNVIKGAAGADIDTLRVAGAGVFDVAKVAEERYFAGGGINTDRISRTALLAAKAFIPQAPVFVDHHMPRVFIVMDGRRFEGAGGFALPFPIRALNTGHLDGLGKR